MATHSSILAWKISWTEEPGGLQSMGLKESGTTERPTLTYSTRDSQEFSPEPQFESITSLAFNLLYGPTLTTIHYYSYYY